MNDVMQRGGEGNSVCLVLGALFCDKYVFPFSWALHDLELYHFLFEFH